ncbi:MAG: LysR family transcriptional regulator, partial [Ruminococcus sp.]|nr:LysR family transcriptional regulator [Ruminococcus sp.]
MTIQQLRYVIVICEEGSLNKASEQLYIAQPSLTSAVQELEKELGITIFNRGGRGVTPTNDGLEFIRYAREVLSQYDNLLEKYGKNGNLKKKFGISTQHYSFAVKSFVEMVKHFGTDEYEFAIRETRTRDVIDDVASGKSEIGILYLNDFNRKPLERLLKSNGLVFTPLTECDAYVYLWKGHPLARKDKIRFEDLK